MIAKQCDTATAQTPSLWKAQGTRQPPEAFVRNDEILLHHFVDAAVHGSWLVFTSGHAGLRNWFLKLNLPRRRTTTSCEGTFGMRACVVVAYLAVEWSHVRPKNSNTAEFITQKEFHVNKIGCNVYGIWLSAAIRNLAREILLFVSAG